MLLTSDILPGASRSEHAGPGSLVLLIGNMPPCASCGCGLIPRSSGALPSASPASPASLRINKVGGHSFCGVNLNPSDIVYIYACDMRYYRAAFPRGFRFDAHSEVCCCTFSLGRPCNDKFNHGKVTGIKEP